MIATPADIRSAFESFQNELDARSEGHEWSMDDVKREFEQWLARQGRPPLAWTAVHEHELALAMSRRYQPYLVSARRWFR